MLQLRPICENCARDLPNESDDAMICSFECTFCIECVVNVLENVCPNCGGGFQKRPSRPTQCVTPDCLTNFPAEIVKKYRPVDKERFVPLKDHYISIDPRRR
jgi:uncharacterized protein